MIYSVFFMVFSLKESIKMHISGDLFETCLHFWHYYVKNILARHE